MASVFLSYDRDDTEKARPLALALEKAGHSVWWDLHVRGGAQFSNVIEEALKAADAVVVLWSERSVKSAWVRDEAAAGRDTGRLVPVSLDATEPPLGFRQFQTIDFTRWRGRGRIPKLKELLGAIEALGGTESNAVPPPITSGDTNQRLRRLLPIGLAVLVAMAAVALFLINPFRTGDSAAVAAVVATDSSAASQDHARDLLAKLGRLQGAGPQPLQLTGESGRERADFIFEVGGGTGGDQARANLVLLDGKTSTLLWSRDFERPASEVGDLRQELGSAAAQVLDCAREAVSGAQLNTETLKLYLSGCAEMAVSSNASDIVPIFRQVIEAAPRFNGAWARLLAAEMETYAIGHYAKGENPAAAQLRADVARARKINPRLPQIYLAEAILLPPDAFAERLRLAEHAVALDPFATESHLARASTLLFMGRLNEAVEDARRAVELDPLSPRVRGQYIYMLFNAGRLEAARKELAEAERLWPEASTVVGIRFAYHLRYGDPVEAWEIIQSGEAHSSWFQAKSYLDARRDPTPANVERAVRDAAVAYEQNGDFGTFQHLVQTLSIFDRESEMFDLLMRAPLEQATGVVDVTFRPAAREFWSDPRSLAYAERIGLLDAWRSSGKWPDFCFEAVLPYDCKVEAARLAS